MTAGRKRDSPLLEEPRCPFIQALLKKRTAPTIGSLKRLTGCAVELDLAFAVRGRGISWENDQRAPFHGFNRVTARQIAIVGQFVERSANIKGVLHGAPSYYDRDGYESRQYPCDKTHIQVLL